MPYLTEKEIDSLLCDAVKSGRTRSVKILVDACSNPTTARFLKAIEVAQEKGHKSAAKLMERARESYLPPRPGGCSEFSPH